MKEVTILQRTDPILRAIAKPVAPAEIGSDKIRTIIENMKIALHSQKDGIAIAAPQIGASYRIFVVDGSLLQKADKDYKGEGGDLVFINPEIVKLSKKKKEVEEGCLSVRWLYGKIKRSQQATIRALNERSQEFERGASGLLAQIFQHECDHLDGTLFIDTAEELWEMTEEEIAELQS